MTYRYEIYDSEYGKGFKIYKDGNLLIDQPFKPGVPGFQGMTEQEAIQEAQNMINYLENQPVITIITIENLTESEKEQITNFLNQLNKNYTIT